MTTPTLDTAQIAEAAFYIWLEEGQPEGRDMDHWLRAQETLSAASANTVKAAPKRKAPAKKAAAKTAEAIADKPKAKTRARKATKA